MNKIILIFGPGQLGKYLEKNLVIPGYKTMLTYAKIHKPINIEIENLAYVINCAAKTNLDWCEDNSEETYLTNYFGAENVSNFTKKNGAFLFHISSEQVIKPINVYADSKLQAEKVILNTNPYSSIIRVSWLYGGLGKNFVELIVNRAKNNLPVFYGKEYSTPTHCEGVRKFIESQIIGNKRYGISYVSDQYNSPITKGRFIEDIYSAIGKNPIWSEEELVYKAKRPSFPSRWDFLNCYREEYEHIGLFKIYCKEIYEKEE